MSEYKGPTDLGKVFDPHDGDYRLHHVGVALSPRERTTGFDLPKPDGTADYLCEPGSPGNTKRVRKAIQRVELVSALTSEYASDDAHCVTYAARTGIWWDTYPRINKGGLALFLERNNDLARDVVFIDIDNPQIPGTGAGTGVPAAKYKNTVPGAVEHWVAQLDRVKSLGWGFYLTSGGSRIVIPLATSEYSADRYEGIVRGLMAMIDEIGWTFVSGEPVHVDVGCKDWTRWMRLPHVKRSARFERASYIDLSAMRAADYEPIADDGPTRTSKRVVRQAVPYTHERVLASEHVRFVPDVAPSMLDSRGGVSRHTIMSACATVLLDKGVPPAIVPAVVAEMGRRMGIDPEHCDGDYRYATETVEKWRGSETRLTAFRTVRDAAPRLAEALDALSVGILGDKLAEIGRQRVMRLPVDAVSAHLREQIAETASVHLRKHNWNDLVRVIAAPCGTGKTEESVTAVQDIASGKYVPAGTGERDAALMTRTAYCAPAMKNAADYQERAHKRGLPVLRLTSPMSERDENGHPVCRYHAHAVALGAINVKHALCDGGETKTNAGSPCIHRAGCLAATGAIALDDSGEPYAVEMTRGMAAQWPHICTTHARIGVALEHVGSAGTLIVDERPELFAVTPIDSDRVGRAVAMLGHFEQDYAARARSLLDALSAVIGTAELDKPIDLASALPADVLAGFREHAGEDRQRPGAPPVRAMSIIGARGMSSPKTSEGIGEAASLLSLLWSVLREQPVRSLCRVVGEKRVMHLAITPEHVAAALFFRKGPTMVLDADAVTFEPEYRAVLKTEHDPFYMLRSEDGAQIDRTVAITRLGARSRVRDRSGTYRPGGAHVELVQIAAKRLASSVQREHLIVTWKPLALIIRAAMCVGPIDADIVAEWAKIEQIADYLAPLAEELRPVIATIHGKVFVLNYGQERGDDNYKTCPSVVTIGDPIPNMDAMTTVAMLLGLSEADAESLGVRATRAQLGQAQDRIRPSRRGTAATAIHIGSGAVGEAAAFPLYPAGWEGRRFTVDSEAHYLETRSDCGKLGGGVPNANAADAAVRKSALLALRAKLGTGAACAKALDISPSAERKYASGARTIPDDVAARVNALLASNDASTAIAA